MHTVGCEHRGWRVRAHSDSAIATSALLGCAVVMVLARCTAHTRPLLLVVAVFGTLLASAGWLVQCGDADTRIVGIDMDYDMSGECVCPSGTPLCSYRPASLTHRCNSACTCARTFEPVCHVDTQLTFYSPCVAGCANHQVHICFISSIHNRCS
jgi:hypothetical protein